MFNVNRMLVVHIWNDSGGKGKYTLNLHLKSLHERVIHSTDSLKLLINSGKKEKKNHCCFAQRQKKYIFIDEIEQTPSINITVTFNLLDCFIKSM